MIFLVINSVYDISHHFGMNIDLEVYCQTSNISHKLGDTIVDHSDVVGASPVGTALTTSSLSTWLQWIGQRQLQNKIRSIEGFLDLVHLILEV